MTIIPVILSGGAGTRLWPLSRSNYPKQFLPLVGDSSMLQETARRFKGDRFAAPMVVCNESHRFTVAEQLHQIGQPAQAIMLEPVGRNTAPAAIVAAIKAQAVDEEAILVFLPSDHVIKNVEAFLKATETAITAARKGKLVCYGVQPTRAETGYGYVQAGDAVDGINGVMTVAKFTEKPDEATAKEFIASGNYYWNSGMFVFRADILLAELESFDPDMVAASRTAVAKAEEDLDFTRLDKESFASIKGDSIDYALMEKTDKAVLVPLDAAWSDVGAFPALADVHAACEDGNVFHGDVLTVDTTGTFVHAERGMVATIGVEDMVIISTDDALLVAPKNRAQDVKAIVDQLKAEGREEAHFHSEVHRPWGSYRPLGAGDRYQVKELIVKPGKRLSVQYHHHRAEHWVVVEGTAKVLNGDKEFLLEENQSTYIPIGATHRLENPGKVPVRIIEVQSGSYLGEDDIVRLEDDFNRSSDD